ncbi:hypothetical protein [Oceaniglobus roseus]|uniref:hypothetical protein n=1 Tax=Oceaniglobus roseus TaxID=1737570 RepID=UPI001FE95739|nr:hypothetical protein [Kandeliimicrobium roseum]
MHRDVVAFSLGFAGLMLAAQRAFAEAPRPATNCAPRAVVAERLADRYGEVRQSIGLGGGNQVVEVFAARDTGTWTILVSTPAGLSCVVAAGQAWEAVTETLPPKGNPA